eukprot:CAMPEP_0178845632 /NCGR_PEP_ID=MMETSP0746-20121128/17553_1 /TAXON_ID=913974 /ORGANISM="Nitzschia punctata, Strain CCMP561" /LENGTH=58 /DNA_ID=CAMNT_0020509865 /DNA_START=13 /DNA_END=186 /DNA_ORIENTATION=-
MTMEPTRRTEETAPDKKLVVVPAPPLNKSSTGSLSPSLLLSPLVHAELATEQSEPITP